MSCGIRRQARSGDGLPVTKRHGNLRISEDSERAGILIYEKRDDPELASDEMLNLLT